MIPTDPQAASDDSLVVHRRKLLKAAASAAPLVATLPLGGAWATSTSQCIADAAAQSAAGQIANTRSWPPPNSDTYVRVQGQQVTFTKGTCCPPRTETAIVYHIAALDGGAEWKYWKADGSSFNPTGWTRGTVANVALLKVFHPVPNATNPLTVEQCIPGTNDSVPTCLFPVTQVQLGSTQNIGIQTSCLCSVSPTSMPPGFCI